MCFELVLKRVQAELKCSEISTLQNCQITVQLNYSVFTVLIH